MAKLSAYVAPFLGAIVGAVMACILRLLGPYYPYAFTSTNTGPCHTFFFFKVYMHSQNNAKPQRSEDRGHALPATLPNLSPIRPSLTPSTHHVLPVVRGQRTRRWCS